MKTVVDKLPKQNVICIDKVPSNAVIGYVTKNSKTFMLGYPLEGDKTFVFINTKDAHSAVGVVIEAFDSRKAIEQTMERFSNLDFSDFIVFDSIQEALQFAVKYNNSNKN
jgi:hypothetical protein